eukprot:3836454-Alexandrium_andersonii.AAC.1
MRLIPQEASSRSLAKPSEVSTPAGSTEDAAPEGGANVATATGCAMGRVARCCVPWRRRGQRQGRR